MMQYPMMIYCLSMARLVRIAGSGPFSLLMLICLIFKACRKRYLRSGSSAKAVSCSAVAGLIF